jgi:hypothetical protein
MGQTATRTPMPQPEMKRPVWNILQKLSAALLVLLEVIMYAKVVAPPGSTPHNTERKHPSWMFLLCPNFYADHIINKDATAPPPENKALAVSMV